MKKSRVWKWIATIGTSAALLLAFIFSIGGGDLFGSLNQDKSDTPQVAQAAGLVERPAGATFGQFPNGYTYVYTDKGSVTDFRAGKIASDLGTKTVSTSSAHGSETNPYVIETVADWENLAKLAGSSANNTSGKVFVIARDIDFSGASFRFIPVFGGALYGVGHKLSNINATAWQYWNGSTWVNVTAAITNAGYGLIGFTSNATIADLILENFSYSGMISLSGLYSGWGNHTGSFVGVNGINSSVMNCHAEGTYTGGPFSQHSFSGGMVGAQTQTGGLIYRCSVDVVVSRSGVKGSWNIHYGGILGDVITYSSNKWQAGNCTVYDCVSNTNFTVVANNTFIGSMISYIRPSNTLTAENVLTYLKYSSVNAKIGRASCRERVCQLV